MVDYLHYKISATVTNMRGCCGAGIVSRISSITKTPSVVADACNKWYEHPQAVAAIVGGRFSPLGWEAEDILVNMDRVRHMPTTLLPSALGHQSWYGAAISLDLAFSAILDKMKGYKYAMYFMTDNVSGSGDVHLGPCNTRDFTKWLGTNQLGSITTPGPVNSLRTDRDIQGWIFIPNWNACNEQIDKAKQQYATMIKEMNKDDRLKARTEGRLSAAARARKNLSSTLLASW